MPRKALRATVDRRRRASLDRRMRTPASRFRDTVNRRRCTCLALSVSKPSPNSLIRPPLIVSRLCFSLATPTSQSYAREGQGAVVAELAVAVDGVSVEIERHPVGADHDPVVRAIDQVCVELRVGGDRVAAGHRASQRLFTAERKDSRDRSGQEQRARWPRCATGMEPGGHRAPLTTLRRARTRSQEGCALDVLPRRSPTPTARRLRGPTGLSSPERHPRTAGGRGQ